MTQDLTSTRPVVHRPRWLAPAALTLSVLGLLVAAYLTYEHYTGSTSLACSATGTIDCHKVTTSKWSMFLGLPVALLGLLYFVALTALCLPAVWRRTGRAMDHLRLVVAAVGLPMVLYLVWAELARIEAICLWCTAVHVLTFVLIVVLAVGSILSYDEKVS